MAERTDIEWKQVVGFEGLYEISSQGEIRSIARTTERSGRPMKIQGGLMKASVNKGYLVTSLRKGNETFRCFIHQAVAEAFIGRRPKGQDTRHLDGNPLNNFAENLAYGTRSQNVADAIRTKGLKTGIDSPNTKLSQDQVDCILESDKTANELAREFGMGAGHIRSIRNGHAWKHEVMPRKASYIRKGEGQANAKLSEENVVEILKSNESNRSLGRKYGVDKVVIARIRKGEAWKCVARPKI